MSSTKAAPAPTAPSPRDLAEHAEGVTQMLLEHAQEWPELTDRRQLANRLVHEQRRALLGAGYDSNEKVYRAVGVAMSAARLMREAGNASQFAAAQKAATAAAKTLATKGGEIREKIESLRSELKNLEDDVDRTGREFLVMEQARESLRTEKFLPPAVWLSWKAHEQWARSCEEYKRMLQLKSEIPAFEKTVAVAAADWREVRGVIDAHRPDLISRKESSSPQPRHAPGSRADRGETVTHLGAEVLDEAGFRAWQAELQVETLPAMHREYAELKDWYDGVLAEGEPLRDWYINQLA